MLRKPLGGNRVVTTASYANFYYAREFAVSARDPVVTFSPPSLRLRTHMEGLVELVDERFAAIKRQ